MSSRTPPFGIKDQGFPERRRGHLRPDVPICCRTRTSGSFRGRSASFCMFPSPSRTAVETADASRYVPLLDPRVTGLQSRGPGSVGAGEPDDRQGTVGLALVAGETRNRLDYPLPGLRTGVPVKLGRDDP